MALLKTPAAIGAKEGILGFTLATKSKKLIKKNQNVCFQIKEVNRMHLMYIVNQVIRLQI